MARRERRIRWPWRRKKREPEGYDTPEAVARRKRAHDAWRSRNAWNHGDPPSISGI